MSKISSYIGTAGVGVSYVLSMLARKRLDDGKKVLMISGERTADFRHENLTWVNNSDLNAVFESYQIINNSALPDVICIDSITIAESESREIENLSDRGVEFHIGQRAVRSSSEETKTTKPKLTMISFISKQVYVIERVFDIDYSTQYALATPTKHRPGNTDKPIVFKIGD